MTHSAHLPVIEAGPGTIRRLCCGTSNDVDAEFSEIHAAALGAVDDRVALVDGRPVTVGVLWRDVLRSLDCGSAGASKEMVVVHPSWWPATRVGVVASAASHSVARPRSWLLTRASSAPPETTVVVEIAERLVAVTGDEVVAVPRRADPRRVADDVAGVIAAMRRGAASVVLIDAPDTLAGASGSAALIAAAIRAANDGRATVTIDDDRFVRLARSAQLPPAQPGEVTVGPQGVRLRARVLSGLAVASAFLAAVVPAWATLSRPGAPRAEVSHAGAVPAEKAETTILVEGRITLAVPANWSIQRVVGGPGSARVQVTSPADPEVALHITQTPVPGETLDGTAQRLKRAIDAEPDAVFVDFNPSGVSAGRPAVTYREMRAGHHVRWTVLLDGVVRISIGCQSRPGGEDAVRDVCEQAVRSAHAFG